MPAKNKGGWQLAKATITDASLPRVLLIGDSILSAYRPRVAKALKGKANVDGWITPIHHGSPNILAQFKEVIAEGPYTVIHFNLGLHGYQKGRIPAGQYIPLTKQLVEQIRASAPKAKIIWASTTPILQKGVVDAVDPELNPVIIDHNALAAQVMAEYQIPVNDLYTLMLPHLHWRAGKTDQFHWQAPAYDVMAKAVVECVEKALQQPAK